MSTVILITGANGFLGSETARQAVAAGMDVRAVDLGKSPIVPGTRYFRADIREPGSLSQALRGVECVVHAAGLAHVFNRRRSKEEDFFIVNERGTKYVAQTAALVNVKHFVLISSVSVYGPTERGSRDESTPLRPEGIYAESKLQAEQRAREIAESSGMSLTILRLTTLYGPGDPGNVARLLASIDRRRFVWVGKGSNLKSLLYVGDAARAILAVANAAPAGIRAFNVCAPPCSIREVVDQMALALGKKGPALGIPASLALRGAWLIDRLSGRSKGSSTEAAILKFLSDDVIDGRLFNRTFAFQTVVSLREGLRREVAWYRG